MVLDLLAFRAHDGGMPEDVRESQRRRNCNPSLVDTIVAADAHWREVSKRANEAKAAMKKGKSAGRGNNPGEVLSAQELSALSSASAAASAEEQALQHALQSMLLSVGNLVHEYAPTEEPKGSLPSSAPSRRAAHQAAVRCEE